MAFTKAQAFCLILVCLGYLLLRMHVERMHMQQDRPVSPGDPESHEHAQSPYYIMAKVVQQRNNISRELNLRQQMLSQKECETSKRAVAPSGGWCAKSSKEDGGHHRTDKRLVPVLAEFLKGKKVASFGDGPGRYKQMLTDTGLLKGYDAYDGAPFSEKTSEGRVVYLDLTLPQYGLPLYDWIISLEVAEHIPKQYEQIYIDNIVRHAKEGIILSWAVPGQGGHSHVNNQPFEYVKNLLHKLGFSHDSDSSERLKNAATLPWLRRNTNVYRRTDMSSTELLEVFYI